MKRINIYTLLLCVVLLFSSCEDYLNTESPSVLSPETVYTTKSMTEAALMGVYATLASDNLYKGRMSINWQGYSDIEGYRGFAETGYNSGETGFQHFWCDIYEYRCRWTDGFRMAELAATAVEGIRNSPLMETEKKAMQVYLGEALTLRALAYFELVRYWGDVPYKEQTANSDLSNVYIGKTDRDVIYDKIIEDLQEAAEYLPWMGQDGYTSERVTKGFAQGLLARVALFAGGWSVRDANQFSDANVEHHPRIADLNGYYTGRRKDWKKYYEIAEQACASVIGSADNPHKLDPDYGDIWKTVCRLDLNSYNENLFEVAMGMGQVGDIGNLMGYGMGTNTKYTNGRSMGGNYVSSHAYYFYSFDRDDLRRDYAVTWASYPNNDTKETIKGDMLNMSLNKWNFFWTSDSWKSLLSTATNRLGNGINWIIMRYPDILLMYAEARNELYGPESKSEVAHISAREALEQVRERAFGAGSLKIKQYDTNFFNAIVNERAWEFGGEAVRKMDLIRWGILDEKIEEMKQTLCLMMDGTQPFTIFDKNFNPGDIPTSVYYKYEDPALSEFIDYKSIEFYKELPGNPDESIYTEVQWGSGRHQYSEKKPTAHLGAYVSVLCAASGLMATYDYSSFYSRLQYGADIRDIMVTKTMGNGKCNNRHLFAIYNQDVYESKGHVSNSYGY